MRKKKSRGSDLRLCAQNCDSEFSVKMKTEVQKFVSIREILKKLRNERGFFVVLKSAKE